jgi:hypothetical protein
MIKKLKQGDTIQLEEGGLLVSGKVQQYSTDEGETTRNKNSKNKFKGINLLIPSKLTYAVLRDCVIISFSKD